MDEPQKIINRTGASSKLMDTFRTIGDAATLDGQAKYPSTPVMLDLAKVIVGMGGGKKDLPIFEMCHLVCAVNHTFDGEAAMERRFRFFFGEQIARPPVYRQWFKSRSEKLSQNVAIKEKGIEIVYSDGSFVVHFNRMPFLNSLYEFLSTMDDFAFFEEFNNLMNTFDVDQPNDKNFSYGYVQEVTNQLSSRLRTYRQDHLPKVYFDGKFDRVFRFLRQNATGNFLQVTDDDILEFWTINSVSSDFRTYKTVFECFIDFVNSLRTVQTSREFSNPASIGAEENILEVANENSFFKEEPLQEWASPLSIFDEEPASRIKFFKQKSERRPLQHMMTYGPIVRQFPLAFLRVETFGQTQSNIVNDLRLKRGPASVARRLDCSEVEPYTAVLSGFRSLLGHIETLQKAAFWAILKDKSVNDTSKTEESNVVRLADHSRDPAEAEIPLPMEPGTIENMALKNEMLEARFAFSSLTRKGFDEDLLNEPAHVSGFRAGAGALLTIGNEVERFLDKLKDMAQETAELDQKFDQDKLVFRKQFDLLYGVK